MGWSWQRNIKQRKNQNNVKLHILQNRSTTLYLLLYVEKETLIVIYVKDVFGKYHGKDISVDDTPVCDKYEFGGSEEKLEAINKAESLGVIELPDDWKENLEV